MFQRVSILALAATRIRLPSLWHLLCQGFTLQASDLENNTRRLRTTIGGCMVHRMLRHDMVVTWNQITGHCADSTDFHRA